MAFLFVLTVGLIAGTISGIVGTGSSIMLMPVLVYAYGPKEAVPIMAVASSPIIYVSPRRHPPQPATRISPTRR